MRRCLRRNNGPCALFNKECLVCELLPSANSCGFSQLSIFLRTLLCYGLTSSNTHNSFANKVMYLDTEF